VRIHGFGNDLFLDNINVNASLIGLDEMADAFGWEIYPNPTNSAFNIRFEEALSEEGTIRILSMDGRILYEETLQKGTGTYAIDPGNRVQGMYHVEYCSEARQSTKLLMIVD